MKKSGAPETGDLVKIREGADYTDWSQYEGIYLVVAERGVDVRLIKEDKSFWIQRRLLDIVSA
jgi:hypothetical protein